MAVHLKLLRAQEAGGELVVVYDKAGEGPTVLRVPVPSSVDADDPCELDFTLERTRFATEGEHGADITLVAFGGTTLTVLDITLRRSRTTVAPTSFGEMQLKVRDEHDAATPALVGLYDERRRMPKVKPTGPHAWLLA